MAIEITKIGGGLIDEPDFGDLLDRIAAGCGPRIIVHGGGPQATALAERLGVAPVRVDGRRITDDATLEIVTMVYAGTTNKRIVAGLAARGCAAIGLTGADAGLLSAVRRPVGDIDYGHVGDITTDDVDVVRLRVLLEAGLLPVLCALTHDGNGNLLNTNADTIAAVVASALAAESDVRLDYVTHTRGLLADPDDPDSVIPECDAILVAELKADGTIGTGMIPKVDNAVRAAEAGATVRIGETQVTPEATSDQWEVASKPEVVSEGGLFGEAVGLLEGLIRTPSLSGEEAGTAALIANFLEGHGYEVERSDNNVWSRTPAWDGMKPTLLLNSHHDTVPPAADYSRSPYDPHREGDRLYGLGSNDAGGPLVTMLATFARLARDPDLPVNLVVAATAEEETSGEKGVASILDTIGPIDCGIVGEPTSLDVAVAEKGLMVLDCTVIGRSGHAAREEGESALYKALADIAWFRDYRFEKESATLGPVKMSVTVISAGSAHNVVPDRCHFTVDVRTTDAYTNEETLALIRDHVSCEVVPRSTRLQPSGIPDDHPLRVAVDACGLCTYGSPTLSDQSRMPFPTIKFGPGNSARSHTADEWIGLGEIEEGMERLESIVRRLCRT